MALPGRRIINGAAGFLSGIRLPTLVIASLDDPWIPGRLYEAVDWSGNPALVPLVVRRGGHVGFHGRNGTAWHDVAIGRFFAAVAGSAATAG
jgi:predicted alpha/beta-fold hydrolase